MRSPALLPGGQSDLLSVCKPISENPTFLEIPTESPHVQRQGVNPPSAPPPHPNTYKGCRFSWENRFQVFQANHVFGLDPRRCVKVNPPPPSHTLSGVSSQLYTGDDQGLLPAEPPGT